MKFGQLNMRNILLEKSYTKCGGETISRLFSKQIKIEQYLWINSLKMLCNLIVYEVDDYQNIKYIETKLQTTCFYFIQSFLKKAKKRSGTSHAVSFSAWFLKRNISLIIFYYLTKFYCLVAFTLWDIEHYVY